jgi:hypothetical protein
MKINKKRIYDDVLDKILSKHENLTDRDFYILLKYGNNCDAKFSSQVYRRLLENALELECFSSVSRKLVNNLRDLDWVFKVCKDILEHKAETA